MRITMYYEDRNHPTTLEVPDEECTVMVEADYRQRLAATEDKESVARRTVQEIMDEDFSKATFNSHQRETRRHISLEAYDIDGNLLAGTEDVETSLHDEDYEELYRAIEKMKPKQRELLKKVYWENIRQVDIARAEGVSESAIAQRMAVIYARLKKFLSAGK